jgi:hypothetical protein
MNLLLICFLLGAQLTSLFDGKTLNGWINEGGANFRVENGVITVDKGPYTWLRTTKTYKNYELKLEFKTTADGNSGVFLRSAATGKPHETGYELQIFDDRKDFRTGSLVGVVEATPSKIRPDQWNTFEVKHVGPRVIVKYNGKQVVDVQDQRSLEGHIGLQFNPNKPISFRNIRIREL